MRIFWIGFILFFFGVILKSEAQILTFKKTPIVFFSPSKSMFQVINNDTLFSSKGLGDAWKMSIIHYQQAMDYNT